MIRSSEVKKVLTADHLACTNNIIVATEMTVHSGSVADFIAITKNYIMTEIEIKVSKNDLIKELKIIESAFSNGKIRLNPSNKRKPWLDNAKLFKHVKYKNIWGSKQMYNSTIIPNKYFIAVPIDLVNITKEYINNKTPYGIISFNKDTKNYVTINIEQKAKLIHKVKPFNLCTMDGITIPIEYKNTIHSLFRRLSFRAAKAL